jgi:hypothetical protein
MQMHRDMRHINTLGLLALFVSVASVGTGCAQTPANESVAATQAALDTDICEDDVDGPAKDDTGTGWEADGKSVALDDQGPFAAEPSTETKTDEAKVDTETPPSAEPSETVPESDTKLDSTDDADAGVRAQSGGLRFLSAPYEGAVELVIDQHGNGKLVTIGSKGSPGGKVVAEVGKIAARDAKGTWWIIDKAARGLKSAGWSITKASVRCIGPAGALMLFGQLAYAGMDEALGPSIAAMGVRQQDCTDRIAKASKGVGCLAAQSATAKCEDAVKACPDAFFGANLVQSCGDEPSMAPLVEVAAAAIGRTGNLPGGRPGSTTAPSTVADAIREGRFATEPDLTCRMRPVIRVLSCEMVEGDLMKVDGFSEAKACWDGAARGVTPWSDSKWTTANKCCTTDACRGHIASLKGC